MVSCVRGIVAVLLLVGMIAFTCCPIGTPTLAHAATQTTITFDDLTAGTSVSNQYHAQGVDFTGDILPTVDEVGSGLANSGTRVADISHCFACEFFIPGVQGTLANAATHVSVRVGYFAISASPGDTATMTLTAFDAGRTAIASDTQTVTEGQGFHTFLSVNSPSATIVSFQISGGDSDTDKLLGIDDLSFDNPNGVPPDFSLSPATSLVNVNQGSSSTDAITINRFNGSQGGVKLSASSVPKGMKVSFSPNPATSTSSA